MKKYLPKDLEQKWQKRWKESGIYRTDLSKPNKYYVLAEYAYPSGDLHVGHWFTFAGADIFARYKRMQGFNVFFPNGFDSFGLPAEGAAIKRGIHPKDWTEDNIERMKQQFSTLGASFDFYGDLASHKPIYYKWNQWIFLQMLEKGLAYRGEYLANWCPTCMTVLANEAVEAGKCWRCGSEVIQKQVEQWFFKLTEYAERLLWPETSSGMASTSLSQDLSLSGAERSRSVTSKKEVDWPKSVREAQNDWIGKSEGAKVKFNLLNNESKYIEVFTTRLDTIFGATFLVVSPEHPIVASLLNSSVILSPEGEESLTDVESKVSEMNSGILHSVQDDTIKQVKDYVEKSKKKSELERKENKDKTGVFSGGYVINSANNEKVPVWIADYVLPGYGTGAIMAVPAHDERDFEFASKFGLPIKRVIAEKADFYKSYLMGGEDITDEDLKQLSVIIAGKTDQGYRLLEVPSSKILEYEELIKEKMTPGFWNEYIGEDVIFIFKHKDGEIERLVLSSETEERIDELGAEFNNQKREGRPQVYKWLYDNEWYKDVALYTGYGTLINSGEFSGLDSESAKQKIVAKLGKGVAESFTTYHIHDWSIGRQRYWGTPIPVIHCDKCGIVPVPEKDLPVELPYDVDYQPKGKAPMASNESWYKVSCPKCSREAHRDPDTMDTFVDSSWYYWRYISPDLETKAFDIDLSKKIMPVDIYFGGGEHTLGHTLYARFMTKVFHDLNLTDLEEFANKRVNHGIVLGPDGAKMSKSKGNVVNPDEEVKKYGADAVRIHVAFFMPYDGVGPWISERIWGPYRFLERVWGLLDKVSTNVIPSEVERSKNKSTDETALKEISPLPMVGRNDSLSSSDLYQMNEQALHFMNKTINKVGNDIEEIKFNTAISALMEWINYLEKKQTVSGKEYTTLLKLLAPFAPHITEELWEILHTSLRYHAVGKQSQTEIAVSPSIIAQGPRNDDFFSIHQQSWPEVDQKYLEEEEVTIAVQVNGKVRDTIKISRSQVEDRESIEKTVMGRERVQKFLEGKSIKKTIYIEGKIFSIVTD